MTFEDAARKVHLEQSRTFRNPKHRAQWIASLEADVFPTIGKRRIDAIASSDVLSVLSPVWTAKPETARRLKQRMRVVFDWAKASGLRAGDNPTEGLVKVLPKHRATAKHHPAMPYERVSEFVSDVQNFDGSELLKLGFAFLILTAARTGEILKATWKEVDLQRKVWTIPADRMKAQREHRVPLSPRAVDILERARTLGGSTASYVFPGRPDRPFSDMAFLMLLRRMGRANVPPHGFRSSFRDWSAERTNAPHAVSEAALAHSQRDKVEAAYRRSDLFEKRRSLMDSWSSFVAGSVGKVVKMREVDPVFWTGA